MSLDGLRQRLRPGRKPARPDVLAQEASQPASAVAGADGAGGGVPDPELVRRRDELAGEFAELQWDLGGLAYEMAARDHFRLDVLVRKAAMLQQVDSELAELERILRLDEAGAAGTCTNCGAFYARGAAFCWQCGKDLLEVAKPASEVLQPQASPRPPAASAPQASAEHQPPAPPARTGTA